MFAIATGLAAAVLAGIAGTASADPPPAALRPNCEHGQANAWANDPQSDLFHGGKLFLCSIGEPPGTTRCLRRV